ncbi:DUF262 domain-containing protein [Lactococcus petauri]|uniref:GmrSD restriction endonucleases N-terminal domain-containing protein n=1 Tax=Lactococcus petauri TaxID=1940789 RepID=A0A252CAN1_9LACT|nr:DUF262 domain-containing protein [Lactococcus petauri]OUK02857.1 hypothetical protein BZZ03_10505 [Lactococcus petauri]
MENRVYYGEYTLKHWIDLILKKNIVLPEYQRFFVWKEDDTRKLIETFKNKGFVPSIIIGSIDIDGNSKNIILDGQQRLTSIFLAYLGLFPDRDKFKLKKKLEKFAEENDFEEENEYYEDVINWRFDRLLEYGSTKAKILEETSSISEYKKIDLNLLEKIFSETYLGFSYIVPKIEDSNDKKKEQQKFYSTVFRHINSQGINLLPQESREALYYLNDDLKEYFNPNFCKNITTPSGKLDFTRYLSLLSQFNEDPGNVNKIAYGYARNMESYYEDYINKFVENPVEIQIANVALVKEKIKKLKFDSKYDSIIDMDIYFFGLIYHVIFFGKEIDFEKRDELKTELKNKIEEYKYLDNKKINYQRRNPNALKYLRTRIGDSITIYERFVK